MHAFLRRVMFFQRCLAVQQQGPGGPGRGNFKYTQGVRNQQPGAPFMPPQQQQGEVVPQQTMPSPGPQVCTSLCSLLLLFAALSRGHAVARGYVTGSSNCEVCCSVLASLGLFVFALVKSCGAGAGLVHISADAIYCFACFFFLGGGGSRGWV